MNNIELALKLTEIKFKNYTFEDYCNTTTNVLDFYNKTLKVIKDKRWLDEQE